MMLTGKISLEEIRANRDSVNLQPKSYKMHPVVCKAFDKMVLVEGTSKVALIERLIIDHWNLTRK